VKFHHCWPPLENYSATIWKNPRLAPLGKNLYNAYDERKMEICEKRQILK